MPTPTEVSPPTDDPGVTSGQPNNFRPSRLNQALAWVGIIAGGLFVVAAIFFSGFFLSWSIGEHTGPMACCSGMKPGEQMMKPGEQMKPGAMMPGKTMGSGMMGPGMMGPGGPKGPVLQPPTTTAPSSPRP